MWKRLFSFGFFVRPWQTMKYEQHPEIGRFDADNFDPLAWRPRVPVAALRHVREDDTLWAALRVMAFTDQQIRAAVKTGGFTDPKAEELLASLLIERRDIIGRVYYARINPLTRFTLSRDGALSFENPAVNADFAQAPAEGYEAEWSTFDNATGESRPIGPTGTTKGDGTSIAAPGTLPETAGAYVKISIRAIESAPSTVDAERHDRLMAYLSHLPQLTTSVLMQAVGGAVSSEDLRLAGRGLIDSSAAASRPENNSCSAASAGSGCQFRIRGEKRLPS
jgi:hypothetical protein